jgi:hypothetical protein
MAKKDQSDYYFYSIKLGTKAPAIVVASPEGEEWQHRDAWVQQVSGGVFGSA